jgi:DNA-binding beta-propeller fold protein YncE
MASLNWVADSSGELLMSPRANLLLCLSTLLFSFASASHPFAQGGTYAKSGEIHIGGAASFDYLNVDSDNKRLYVTHGTEVVVIDTATNTIVGRIPDTPRVHGIAIAPGGRGFVSNGGENKVSIIDLKSLQLISKVDTGANPDAIFYDSKLKEIWAVNHSTTSATAIDAASGKVNATVTLSGSGESGQSDPSLGRVFINIEDKHTVDVVDVTTHKAIASWPVAPAKSPTGMAIDAAAHRLFVGGGPSVVMMDASSGKVVASAPICAGTDATWLDAGTHMVFVSCADGHITALKVNGDSMTVAQTIETSRAARTMAIDPATHRIYTAAPVFQSEPGAAAGTRPTAVPDSFRVLYFDMK